MKVLFPTPPGTNGGYPRVQGRPGLGGIESAMYKMIPVLVEAGHQVDLLTPDNFPVDDDRVGQISPGFLSKVEAGKNNWKKWTEGILDVADGYDRIFLNNVQLNLNLKDADRFRQYCPAIRAVYHHYDEQIDGSFMAPQLQIFSEIKRLGGRVSCVSPTLNQYVRKKYPSGKLVESPYLIEHLTKDITGLEFEMFQVGIALKPESIKDSNGDFVFIGRGVKEKNLKLALQAFAKANTGERRLIVFTTKPSEVSSQDYWEECINMDIPAASLRIDAYRPDIMSAISGGSILVFPSKKESFGIVPLEASSFGMNIIHKDLRAGCYTEADTHLPRMTVNSLARAMEEIRIPTLEEKKKRSAWTQKEFSETKFAESLLSFVM